ncbi:hypothetical protein SGLAM104S_05283 [Streptomyces glaucescens]
MAVVVGRVLLADHLVEPRPLVVVEQRDPVRVQREQLPGEGEHVEGVATFARVLVQVAGDGVRGTEVLRLAVAADGVGVRVDGEVPGVGGDVPVPGRAGGLVLPGGPDPLGHLGVGVQSTQLVLAGRQGVEHRGVVEPPGDGEPPRVACLLVEVGQHRVHAAELGLQHGLHLLAAQPAGAPVDPPGQGEQHVAGLCAADVTPHVQQAGEGLVDGVVRHIAVAQGPLLESGEVGLGVAGEIPGVETGGAVVGLAFGQLRDHVGGLVPADGVPGHGVQLCPGREEVTLDVGAEGEVRCVPAAGGGGAVGGEPVIGAEVVQQPVDIDEPQIVLRSVLVVQPPACGEPDLAEFEGVRQDPYVGPCGRNGRLRGRCAHEGSRGRCGDRGPGYLQQAPSADEGRHLAPFDDERAIAWSLTPCCGRPGRTRPRPAGAAATAGSSGRRRSSVRPPRRPPSRTALSSTLPLRTQAMVWYPPPSLWTGRPTAGSTRRCRATG